MNEDKLITKRLRIYRRVLHIRRRLSGTNNKVLVKVGDEIKPEDIVGEYQTSSGFTTIDLASRLKISPNEVPKYLKKQLGSTIYRGELLAQKENLLGLSKEIITAPSDGVMDLLDLQTGVLKLKFLSKKESVVSGVYGVVEGVDPARGVITVKTMAHLIFGMTGSGRDRSGLIRVLGDNELLVSSSHLKDESKGSLLVGGAMLFDDALQKAVKLKVSGVITGGIDASLFKTIRGGLTDFKKPGSSDVGISLLVTEGFGNAPIGPDIFELLKSYEGKFAMIDGNKARLILPTTDPSSIIYIRKTKLPQDLDEDKSPLVSFSDVKIGEKVRIIYPSLLGVQGVVESIDDAMTLLPSGVSANLVTVVTPTQKVRVPLQSVEAIYSL